MIHKRLLLFLVGCIGSRSYLAYLAKTISPKYLPYMGTLALIPAIGFTIIYLFGLRKTGLEVGGGTIWWNQMRPIHALLYFVFAFSAITKKRFAWLILALDVLIGFIAYILHYRI